MNRTDFEFILAGRMRKIKEVLGKKAVEYSSNSDRLHNFKASAKLQSHTSETTPAKEAWGMAKKHLISIQDMICMKRNKLTLELIDEKIGDAINYLILIEAILRKEISD